MRKILLQTMVVNLIFLLIFTSAIAGWLAWTIPFAEVEKIKQGIHPRKSWATLREINRNAVTAIVVSEDWSFYRHNGIDWAQLVEAIHDYYYDGKKLRGASTITQQVAKNLFLTNERSYYRKFKEALIAVYLERELTKAQILETYLNVVQFGKNLYGIRNASNYYFHKSPSRLTPREGAFLAMLLPNPERYSVSFYRKELTHFANRSISNILAKMRAYGTINTDAVESEKHSPFDWEKVEELQEEEAIVATESPEGEEVVPESIPNAQEPEPVQVDVQPTQVKEDHTL